MTSLNNRPSDIAMDYSGIFKDEYATLYPQKSMHTKASMVRSFRSFVYQLSVMAKGYKQLRSEVEYEWMLVEDIRQVKLFLLFYGMDFEDTASLFKAFLLERNMAEEDDGEDSALLFYASLQSEEVKKVTEGLPLNILYDMFMPVSDANFEKWKLTS
jgi:hypothetical protein